MNLYHISYILNSGPGYQEGGDAYQAGASQADAISRLTTNLGLAPSVTLNVNSCEEICQSPNFFAS